MMSHNDAISPIVVSAAGEVNSDLIDKLFRSLKTGGSQNYDVVSAKYSEIEKLRNTSSGEN